MQIPSNNADAASGVVRSTPDDNSDILISLLAVGAAYNSAVGADLAATFFPGASSATFAATYSLSHALRLIPPYFEPPDDKAVTPLVDNDGQSCIFTYTGPAAKYTYNNALGIVDTYPDNDDWGFVGPPFVKHWDSQVQIRVSGLESGSGATLTEGRHQVRWIAATQYSPIFDTAIPPAMFYVFNKIKHAKSLARLKKAITSKLKFLSRGASNSSRLSGSINVMKVAAKLGLKVGSNYVQGTSPYDLGLDSAVNEATQTITIWDIHPPFFRDPVTDNLLTQQVITLEATDFGGARFDRVRDQLRSAFISVDGCDRPLQTEPVDPPPLLELGAAGSVIVWDTYDEGPYDHNLWSRPGLLASNQRLVGSDQVRTSIVQRVFVIDSQAPLLVPPPGFSIESGSDVVLGKALVADLADPMPRVNNNAPESFEPDKRYRIEWEATDSSGNSTTAPVEDPDRYIQIVTVKTPDTNQTPTATPPPGAQMATTSNPVEIILSGIDPDLLPFADNPTQLVADPLTFEIETSPQHGSFEAPLEPYFIEDLRLTPERFPQSADTALSVPCLRDEPTLDDTGANLAAKLALISYNEHDDFIERCYCTNASGGAASNVDPPRDLIYKPRYVHVTDDNTYYMSDEPLTCENQGSTVDTGSYQRISKWRDGVLLAEKKVSFSNFDGVFDVDPAGNLWWFTITAAGSSTEGFLNGIGPDLENLPESGGTTTIAKYESSSAPGLSAGSLKTATVDTVNNIIYVTDRSGIFAFDRSDPEDGYLGRVMREDEPLQEGGFGATGRILEDGFFYDGLGFTMQVDSEGNLYVADSKRNKIHKIGPPLVAADGSKSPGEYIGWLGRCAGNAVDENLVPYNACDVSDPDPSHWRSRGYACDKRKCLFDDTESGSAGAWIGQFDGVSHLNIDPNDLLYIADIFNQRVQRFAPDGTFVGQAVSDDAGVSNTGSFVLGNMGDPRHVSVNSEHFYVLETNIENQQDFFLHIFKTTPLYDLTPNSAKVKYVSEFDFQGADSFSFSVNDGLAKSTPAQVDINVSRSFRSPENLRATCFANSDFSSDSEIPCVGNEDQSLHIRLSGDDLDGFVMPGGSGLDVLTFSIEEPPSNGTLTLLQSFANRAEYRYDPAQDFNGTDHFKFQAHDGVAFAQVPGDIEISITPVYDPPTLELPTTIEAPRGFPLFIEIPFEDVDRDPDEAFVLNRIEWGDGQIAVETTEWTGHGLFDLEGHPIDPVVTTAAGEGFLRAMHDYDSASNNLTLCYLGGSPGVPGETCQSIPLSIVEATLLSADQSVPGDAGILPGDDFPLQIDVTNHKPSSWDGRAALDVGIRFSLPEGLTLPIIDPACAPPTSSGEIVCDLGEMAPDTTRALNFSANYTLEQARLDPAFTLDIEITDSGTSLSQPTASAISIFSADRDEDGTLDVDDAFPLLPDYNQDSDFDGMPDEFEREYGFDIEVPDDSNADSDGDGQTNVEEFLAGTSPRLKDDGGFMHAGPHLTSGTQSIDDFGAALGTGDINGDGRTDFVFGAPDTDNGQWDGRVHIGYGQEDGSVVIQDTLIAPVFYDRFGVQVAVADFDNNGFADIAINADGPSIMLYFNDEAGLPSSPRIVTAEGTQLGESLAAGDVDGDGVADLIATNTDENLSLPSGGDATGAALVFLFRDGWTDTDDQFPTPRYLFGSAQNQRIGGAIALGDVDGDNQLDIFLSSPFLGNGVVIGFLGKNLDWANFGESIDEYGQPDVILSGEAPGTRFGFSMDAGDIDGDGKDDLVVGAYRQNNETSQRVGAAYVFLGADEFWSTRTYSQRLLGSAVDDQFGVRVAVVGRVDPDPFAEVIVGANRVDGVAGADIGEVRVYRGTAAGLAPSAVFLAQGESQSHYGYQLARAINIERDIGAQAVVGAPRVLSTTQPGYAQILYPGGAPLEDDADNDRVGDMRDNCPTVVNTNQLNADGDTLGDACDNCPDSATSEDQTDTDADGIGDLCDTDDDNDGVVDTEDAWPLQALYARDEDGDGMDDTWERRYGLDVTRNDAHENPDADAFDNLREFTYGLNPTTDERVRHFGSTPPPESESAWFVVAEPEIDGAYGVETDPNASNCPAPCPYWRVRGRATAAYEIDGVASGLVNLGQDLGWSLRARVRVITGTLAGENLQVSFSDGGKEWLMTLKAASSNAVIEIPTSGSPQSFAGSSAANYQLVELIFYPDSQTADVLINGQFRGTTMGNAIAQTTDVASPAAVRWQAQESRLLDGSNWNLVEWSVAPDTDGDGVLDVQERQFYGTKPYNPDSDGDGVDDGEELAAGTDPNESSSFPQATDVQIPLLPLPALVLFALALLCLVIAHNRMHRDGAQQ